MTIALLTIAYAFIPKKKQFCPAKIRAINTTLYSFTFHY